MKFKRIGILILAGLVAISGFLFWHRRNQKQDSQTASETLGPNEEAKIIIDPVRRTIVVVTPAHVKTTTLPDRPSSITLLKNDGMKVVSPQFGTEVRPFLTGIYTLNGGKLGLGCDFVYWKRADLGGGFAVNPLRVQDTTIFIGVSYFIYSNTSLMLGLDNKTTPLIGLKVRF